MKDPFALQIDITTKCNLKCSVCYHKNSKNVNEYMPIKIYKQVLDQYKQFTNKYNLLPEIIFAGGEPLIDKTMLLDFIKIAKYDYSITSIFILTNGTLIDSDFLVKIKKLSVEIQISYDVFHESYDLIDLKKIITMFKYHEISLNMAVILSKLTEPLNIFFNVIDKYEMPVCFVRLVPTDESSFNLLLEPYELREIYKEISIFSSKSKKLKYLTRGPLFNLLNKKIGGIDLTGLYGATFDTDGNMFCNSRLRTQLGNIINNSFDNLWFYNNTLLKLRNNDIQLCKDCLHFKKCRGNRAIANAYFNDYLAPDPQCWKIFDKLPNRNLFNK